MAYHGFLGDGYISEGLWIDGELPFDTGGYHLPVKAGAICLSN